MKYRDVFGACLDAAGARYHERSLLEQFKRPGERAKIIGLGRCLPAPMLRLIMRVISSDTFPLTDSLHKNPVAFGCETIVYDFQSPDKSQVVKMYNGFFDAYEMLSEQKKRTDLLKTHLGDLAVTQQYVISESPYRTGTPTLLAIQEKVDGQDYFAVPELADPAQSSQLWYGARQMLAESGYIPDFCGKRNILVTEEGAIRVVDNGAVVLDDLRLDLQAIMHDRIAVVRDHMSADMPAA